MLWNHCNPAALCYLFTNTLKVVEEDSEHETAKPQMAPTPPLPLREEPNFRDYCQSGAHEKVHAFHQFVNCNAAQGAHSVL